MVIPLSEFTIATAGPFSKAAAIAALIFSSSEFPFIFSKVDAFDFALISEGVLNSDRIYDESNVLKVRLHGLVSSDYAKYFEFDEFMKNCTNPEQVVYW